MMLNMSNKFDSYQHSLGSSANLSASMSTACSAELTAAAAAVAAAASKAERESIHSGQFMVSHFEAEEEAQDDLADAGDAGLMIDPDTEDLTKQDESYTCMDVQLYRPLKKSHLQRDGNTSVELITSHLEIETSLRKLFKCMNLAYSQKLTSPKWNHFKGIRLRWKEKIRLNNVIWRCWHMQFILKRRTPVCQFASPLDVDIHSNPQSVVLEGKYWKRQVAVIQAEYRKWRLNSKSKASGCLTYDSKSDFDFFQFSPSSRSYTYCDDWTNDTLFSSINVPFPFPDSREIARGAGNSDFIQPSLGPLQPNIDDIGITFEELLNPRLPPVPEEGADDMLKSVDYGFSAIMGADSMDPSSIMDITTSSVSQLQNTEDTNMLELNTPLDTLPYEDLQSQFARQTNSDAVALLGNQTTNNTDMVVSDDTIMTDEHSASLLPEVSTLTRTQNKQFSNISDTTLGRPLCNDFTGKSVIKGRISKPFSRPFRREPHNYDKTQPTLHQFNIYKQFAEQQKAQQQQHQYLQTQLADSVLQTQANSYQWQKQQQQQSQQQVLYSTTGGTLIGNGNNNYAFNNDVSGTIGGLHVNNNMLGLQGSLSNADNYNFVQTSSNVQPQTQVTTTVASTPTHNILLGTKIEPSPAKVLPVYNLANANDIYVSNNIVNNSVGNSNANAYEPYSKSASTGAYINIRTSSVPQAYLQEQSQQAATHMHAQSLPLSLNGQFSALTNSLQRNQTLAQSQLTPASNQQQHQQQQHLVQLHQQQQQEQQQQQQNQVNLQKEMYRSNSLPLSVTRISHENFVVPKYTKNNKSRTRSNSIHQHSVGSTSGASSKILVSQRLQEANSDPMLNSQLAQLLTTNNRMPQLGKQQSSSTSAISSLNVPMTILPLSTTTASNNSTMVAVPVSNIFMPLTQSSPTAQLVGANSTQLTTNTSSVQEVLQRQQQQTQLQQQHQQQQQQQQPHKSPKKSTSLPTPSVTPMIMHSPPNSKLLTYPQTPSTSSVASSPHLRLSPESFHDQDSPLSPSHSVKYPRDIQRRAGHIHAEQKRRCNIKNGFEMLNSLIPQLKQNPNAKLSKAAMLQKGADHIKYLRTERAALKKKMEALQAERDVLNNSLTHLQSILPANGAPVTRQGTEHVRQLYEQYIKYRTMNNWKFWILGLILEPLLASYTSSVSSASMEELRRTAFLWVEQHCSLIDLRPAVSNKLKYLSRNTDILSDPPSTLQEEVVKAVHNTNGQHPNLHGT